MYFHVLVSAKGDTYPEVRLDLSEDELVTRFLEPYGAGRPITIGGRTILPSELERIKIGASSWSAAERAPALLEERSKSRYITSIPDLVYVANKTEDVTDHFITGPPGDMVDQMAQIKEDTSMAPIERSTGSQPDPLTVFVVHGRNLALRNEVFTFLGSIGLRALEFAEAIALTGQGSPYVGDVLSVAFAKAQAIVVILSPDDEAWLKPSLRGASEPPHETILTGQARPNVLFEAGMAMGRDPNRTVLVEFGDLRPFSDIGGRHVVRLSNSSTRRQEFAQRLINAGCAVNLSGTFWHTAGNLEIVGDEVRDSNPAAESGEDSA